MKPEYPRQRPDTRRDERMGEEISSHPAFGRVVVTTTHGGMRLFGSDLDHSRSIRLEFEEAEERRSHHHTHAYGRRTVLVVNLSEAQWCRMVASSGNGSGTECTISRGPAADATMENKPMIEAPGTGERISSEIAAEMRARIETVTKATAALSALIAEGAGKKALREAMNSLECQVANFPLNVAYGEEVLHEAMERIVADGKVEIEAYAAHVITRTGLDAIANGYVAPQIAGERTRRSGETVDVEAREIRGAEDAS